MISARQELAKASFEPSPREAWLLARHVLGLTEASAMARGTQALGTAEQARLDALLARRTRGEPMAYLFGRREFYGRDFEVDSRVLIPRPETEHLIAAALSLELPPSPLVLDLGTGCGCLAVTLALELRGSRLVAVDRSLAALAVARANARCHGVIDRVRLVAGDLATALSLRGFDLVVTNPPYVATLEAPRLSPEVRDFEPDEALFAGPDGTDMLGRVLELALYLRPGAWLLSEIGDGQLPWLRARLLELYPAGEATLADCHADYAGKPRVVVLRRS